MKPTRVLTTLLLAPLAALLCLTPSVSAQDHKPVLIESKRIWDKAQYNSFTDLTRFRDQWFCCFREGIAHTADIGKVRVLRSLDGVEWSSAALIEEDGIDLRDPKFSIKPDGQLMIIAGGSTYDMSIKPAPTKTKQPRVINAPASRLKKSCRGGSSWDFVWTSSQLVSVFGVCRWKRSGLSGRDNNGAA